MGLLFLGGRGDKRILPLLYLKYILVVSQYFVSVDTFYISLFLCSSDLFFNAFIQQTVSAAFNDPLPPSTSGKA